MAKQLDATEKDLAQDRDLAALARNVVNLTAAIAALQARVDAIENRPPPVAPIVLPQMAPRRSFWSRLFG